LGITNNKEHEDDVHQEEERPTKIRSLSERSCEGKAYCIHWLRQKVMSADEVNKRRYCSDRDHVLVSEDTILL